MPEWWKEKQRSGYCTAPAEAQIVHLSWTDTQTASEFPFTLKSTLGFTLTHHLSLKKAHWPTRFMSAPQNSSQETEWVKHDKFTLLVINEKVVFFFFKSRGLSIIEIQAHVPLRLTARTCNIRAVQSIDNIYKRCIMEFRDLYQWQYCSDYSLLSKRRCYVSVIQVICL